jgi:general L-amino acid transport system ATP-binding protein
MNKWYGDFHVLRDINLKVMRGERIVIAARPVRANPP